MGGAERKAKLALGAGVWLFLAALLYLNVFSNINLTLQNGLYGGGEPREDIVLVEIDDASLQRVGRWPWDRQRFAELVERLAPARVVGIDVGFFEPSNNESDAALARAIQSAGNVVIPLEYTSFERTPEGIRGKEALFPASGIGGGARALAYVNVNTDDDGVARSLHIRLSDRYDAFPYALYRALGNEPLPFAEDRFLIDFIGPPGSFKRASAWEVIEGRAGRELFEGKVVLVGATSPDLHDDYIVPTSGGRRMPGVELHANALQAMLTHRLLARQDGLSASLAMLLAVSLAFALAARLRLLRAGLALLTLLVLYYFAAILAFERTGLLLNLVYPPLAAVLGFGAWVANAYLSESRQRRFVTDAFGKYVSPELLREIIAHPEKLRLGGEKVHATIFFSDIRGFTTLSEKLKPEELVHFLNEYLSDMTRIVMHNQGAVDKFIGDAVMAIWGAPVHHADHARRACESALEMLEHLDRKRDEWKRAGFPPIEIGIGINTGEVVVGNLGSYERFDYTAIGDEVNLASRLEGLNKEYRTRLLVSDSTRRQAGDGFVFREVDLVAVKGKAQAVRLYELVGRKGGVPEAVLRRMGLFEQGLHAYRKQKWRDARAHFEKASELGDAAAEVFLERCRQYEKHAPPRDWSGVHAMKTK